MRLILTHEQADFDALASLLGAYLLDETSIPVLPRKLNRNVRSFITLYGFDLPFIDPQDLPSEKVEKVTLVDTQSMITIKGMHNKTQVTVIDHHPLRSNLPNDWEVIHVNTGAITTYFIELNIERQPTLSILYATLLLLGIYEDTGSLLYKNTTGRDGRAAAYLIDQGANLEIAVEFLNPPLSKEQKTFFEILSSNASLQEINGHKILIASGNMEEFSEEISTLAHKLRDFYDPDALFVIVSTNEGIRLVARSTSDHIDVGAIAKLFGGGGHDRAAAALIRKEDLIGSGDACGKVFQELLSILPKHVKPSITVAQIMSKLPHVLSPDTSLSKASQLMQLYGYEGYPVLEDGKVIGLITRKVVDKALSHQLNLSVRSLMDANEVWVNPGDSIQQLQSCMTDTGWGQIPVVDPKSGEMVGIVTRTDLLKTLSPKPKIRSKTNLEEQLNNAIPSQFMKMIKSIALEAEKIKVPIFVVGGVVRDLLLDRPSMDLDIVVEGDAIQLAKIVENKYGGRITVHKRFGTAKWILEGSSYKGKDIPDSLDFITARLEFYSHPTALPTIEQSSIKFDLHRRDFTINTLAIRLDGKRFGELYDFWGGLSDLKNHTIRVLHSLSFIDDPTRILRAIRFEQRFGFNLEERTLQLLLDARTLISNLSGDRIRHEIDLILEEENFELILSRLQELEILNMIHPTLIWSSSIQKLITNKIKKAPPKEWKLSKESEDIFIRKNLIYLLWFAQISRDAIGSLCDRLKSPHSLKRNLTQISKLLDRLPWMEKVTSSRIVSMLDEVSLSAIYITWLFANNNQKQIINSYVVKWRFIKPVTTGWDLQQRGVSKGPIFKSILKRLRSAWLDGEVQSPQEELILLENILASK